MESRLVLFLFFIALTIGAVSLSGYKKFFNNSRDLSQKNLVAKKEAKPRNEAETEEVEVEVSQPKAVVLSSEQLKRAHAIYTGKGECIRCHGEFGQGNPKEEAPVIAGQHDWYIVDQLNKMKKGERVNEKMNPYLKGLTENDFKDLAAYITELRAGSKAE